MNLIDFSKGKQKEDILRSGGIFQDRDGDYIVRQFDYLWNKKKRKQMKSKVPFVMARTLKISPYACYRVPIIQTDYCNMRCWFCFVDDMNKDGTQGLEKDVSNVVEDIQKIMKKNPMMNFIRISGGEPTLDTDTYPFMREWFDKTPYGLWLDTNLLGHYRVDMHTFIDEKRFGMSLCLKGINRENVLANCGKDVFKKQLKNLDLLYNSFYRRDIALYVINNFPSGDIFNKLWEFYFKLKDIHPDLPKKVEWLKIAFYGPTVERGKKLDKIQRKLNYRRIPLIPEATEKLWSDILVQDTGKDYYYHLLMS